MDIKGQTAIITGGGSGLGAATARHLAYLGAKIAVFDRDYAKAETVADEIGGMAIACDVSDESSVQAAIAQATATLGAARICVNCAGIVTAARLVGKKGPMPLGDFSRVITINLIGTLNVMRLAAHAMSQLGPLTDDGERGVIINTASIAAFEGQIGQVAYSAAKGGVVAMTLPAARELAQWGIRVVTIAPGLMDTPMLAELPETVRAALAADIPFPQRLGKPGEFASTVAHIIDNPLLNGSVIRLDGGLRLR